MSRPVSAEDQWKLWPRIARPFECKSCGLRYEATLDPEVESTQRQFMREVGAEQTQLGQIFGLGGTCFVHDRYPRWRFCHNVSCAKGFDYEAEAAGERLRPPRLNMRKRWLPMPKAANS